MSVTATVVKMLIYFWPFIKEAFFGRNFKTHVKRNKWVVVSVIFNIVTMLFLLSALETTVAFNSMLVEQRQKVANLEAELHALKIKQPEYHIPDYIKVQLQSLKDEITALKAENLELRQVHAAQALSDSRGSRESMYYKLKAIED